MDINLDLFQQEWDKIVAKLDAISNLPSVHEYGKTFERIDIHDDEFEYITSTDYSRGGGTDYFSLYVTKEDINKPIEYFREKFTEELRLKTAKEEIAKEQQRLRKEELECKQFEELKQKFGL